MPAATAESLGRELADIIAALHQPPPTRYAPVAYGEVLAVASPYFTIRLDSGTEMTIPHGGITPLVGRTWRIRQILGGWIGDDWAAARDLA